MLDIVISFLTFVLILVSLFLVLVILMQRGSSSGGMGAAFGGGVAESAFGAETTNILTKATKWAAFAFFIIALVLYLMYMSKTADSTVSVEALPEMAVAAEAVDTAAEAEQSAIAESEPVGEPSQSESAPETPAEPGN